jgi:glycosyltransferase involved in cell wall biosynthesis
MRVLHIIDSLNVSDGGPPRFVLELDMALNRIPHVVSRIVSMRGSKAASVSAGARATSYGGPRPRWLRGQEDGVGPFTILRILRTSDIVVIHGYFALWIPVAAVLGRLLGADVHLTPHGSLTSYQQTFSVGRKRVYEAVVGKALRGALTSFVLQSAVEEFDINELHPRVGSFVGGVGTVLPLHPTIGGPVHAPLRLVSVSRIAPKKNVEVMLRGVRLLLDGGAEVQLTIAGVGKPEYVTGLRALAEELQISHVVNFAGTVTGDDKRRLYEQSDVFILPSDDENFGIGVAESLAHGVPVVATAAVAAASNIKGDAGRIIASPEPRLLADAIQELASVKPFESARMQSLEVARDSFDWDAVARRWVAGIVSAAEGHGTMTQNKSMPASNGRGSDYDAEVRA